MDRSRRRTIVWELPEIADELPVVSYADDFDVQYKEGVSFTYMYIFDDHFERLYFITRYDDRRYLSYLEDLPKGTYYISIVATQLGRYIEEDDDYEHHGYDCVFKLKVNQ